MSDEHHTRAALENQAFALMGRLHVTLRRQTGRVTDIEYMRIDPAYCRYLLKMASLSPIEDLQELSIKLHEIFFGAEGLFVVAEPKPPLIDRFKEHAPAPPPPAATPSASTDNGDPVDRGYIGRLR
ncbi:hypothetical protein [Herminiimonas fonticola]|uniref:Uncharacterized protein n=1 Tax=Herminiimonas fonticola TaxID=303380 RepID=A0A4V3BV37_9BURK|nr:hypothetical protein [Herminiimonas fonticola]RBA23070.1 hypothetical protein Hfont_2873 [Herminiimonas fonticola]TDN89488.1 hypothetical protein EV677_1545 [Herminiimonas fonticola]